MRIPNFYGSRGLFILAAMLVTFGTASAGEQAISRYTSTARSKAISFKEDNEEAGGFRGLFPGLGGYQLEHLSGDERSWINICFGKAKTDLYSATMKVGPGAFPHKANDVVEWRGVEVNGRFQPYAVIYRLAGVDEEKKLTKTRLIVIKLDKERSAIVGYAEGANEDEKAKKLADNARE